VIRHQSVNRAEEGMARAGVKEEFTSEDEIVR